MSSTTPLLTYEETLAMSGDPLEEVIEGEIHKLPLPRPGHLNLIDTLSEVLRFGLRERRFGY